MKTYEVWVNKFDGKGEKQYLFDKEETEKLKELTIKAIENEWYIKII